MAPEIQIVLFMKHQRDTSHRVIIMSRSRVADVVVACESVRPLSQTGDNRERFMKKEIDLAIGLRTGQVGPSAVAVNE